MVESCILYPAAGSRRASSDSARGSPTEAYQRPVEAYRPLPEASARPTGAYRGLPAPNRGLPTPTEAYQRPKEPYQPLPEAGHCVCFTRAYTGSDAMPWRAVLAKPAEERAREEAAGTLRRASLARRGCCLPR